jgi:hypothetical protein
MIGNNLDRRADGMNRTGLLVLIIFGLIIPLFKSSFVCAQGAPPQPPPGVVEGEDLWRLGLKPQAIERVSPGVFSLGDIMIHKETRSVSFPAQVNMDQGLLEYLIVRSSGKVHESLLRTNIEPYNLQIAFLLLGFEGTDRPIMGQGAPEKPKGDPVEIIIQLGKGADGTRGIKGEEWVAKKVNDKMVPTGEIDWVFTGSVVVDRQFIAQAGGSIVAIYHDSGALIDNASPGGESDEIWFVKEGTVPPVGTPVTVMIRARR